MTRQDIEQEYEVVNGIIQNPGKFEGEMLYVPFFYDAMLQGMGTETLSDDSELFELDDDDRAMFPELGTSAFLVLSESDSGFANAELFDESNDPRNVACEWCEMEPCECTDDDDDASDEPDDDAITTTDHITFYQYGKVWLKVDCCDDPPDDLNAQIKAEMDRQQFWPDVWFISDHGNAHRMSLNEE